MRRAVRAWLTGCLTTIILSAPALADTIYLQATFDQEPVDMPIGTGGAAMGQPTYADGNVLATVRSEPMSSNCLELQDNSDYYAGIVRFELLESAEITSGLAAITFNLWPVALSPGYDFTVRIAEQGGSAWKFAHLFFAADGELRHSDENTEEQGIGDYTVGHTIPVALVFDLDTGTYDVWLGGVLLLDDEEHGITERGVGRIVFTCIHDGDLVGNFYVDDILVTDTFTPTPVEPASWGRIKGLFR